MVAAALAQQDKQVGKLFKADSTLSQRVRDGENSVLGAEREAELDRISKDPQLWPYSNFSSQLKQTRTVVYNCRAWCRYGFMCILTSWAGNADLSLEHAHVVIEL